MYLTIKKIIPITNIAPITIAGIIASSKVKSDFIYLFCSTVYSTGIAPLFSNIAMFEACSR